MRLKLLILLCCSLLGCSIALAPAQAAETQSRLEAIKARKSLSCAGFSRPGLALTMQGAWRGLYVELCHAIAVAALGENADFEFNGLELPKDVDALRNGEFDVAFLSGSEISEHKLAAAVLPGPPVFYESQAMMVADNSSAQAPEDLAGALICFKQSGAAIDSLHDRFDQKNLAFMPFGFQEDIEFLDTYNVQRCKAAVGELTELAFMRLHKGVNRLESRILDANLAVFPILAVTPTADAQWSATVDWIVHFVQAAESKQTHWRAGGANALALKPGDLPLEAKWRENVLSAVGDYGALYERSLGAGSPYKLPRGVNALWSAGGLFAPPVAD